MGRALGRAPLPRATPSVVGDAAPYTFHMDASIAAERQVERTSPPVGLTLESLRARWDEVVAWVTARHVVHGAWAAWCWPARVDAGVVEIDAPIRESNTCTRVRFRQTLFEEAIETLFGVETEINLVMPEARSCD